MELLCELSRNTISVIMTFTGCNGQDFKNMEILQDSLVLDFSQGLPAA